MIASSNNVVFLIYLYISIQCGLSILLYVLIRRRNNDLYHALHYEQEKQKAEDLEKQRQKIIDVYKTQLEIRQAKRTFEKGDIASDINQEKIHEILDKLKEDYTSENLFLIAQLENHQLNFQKALGYINQAIELDNSLSEENNERKSNYEFYELKSKILKSLNLIEDADATDRIAVKIKNETAFLNNKGKKILLEKLSLESVSIFSDFTWSFKPGMNILLGKNGYGKSHLLGLLIALLYDDKSKVRDWISNSTKSVAKLYLNGDIPGKEIEKQIVKDYQEIEHMQLELDKKVEVYKTNRKESFSNDDLKKVFSAEIEALTVSNNKIIELEKKLEQEKLTISADINTINSKTGRIPILAIPDSRFINKSENSIEVVLKEFDDLAQYGAYEFLYDQPYAQVIKNVFFNISLQYFENGKTFSTEPFGLVKNIIKELSNDRLAIKDGKTYYQDDSKFEFVSIERLNKTGSFQINVKPEDTDITLPIQKLSQGTFSLIAIFCLIYNFLKAVYGNEADLLKKPAIVFIDEIDAHIHPSWQRRLVNLLRKTFPNVQFIISAHSPLIIEGCKTGEVSVLRRTQDSKFKIEMINKSLVGYTIEDIYSIVFEIENRDLNLLRYQELAPYKNEFHKELLELKVKKDENLKPDEINRIAELQELILQIDNALKLQERRQERHEKEYNQILDFQESAVKECKTTEEKSSLKNTDPS